MNLEAVVSTLLGELTAAWNSYDATGFAAHFDERADFVDVLGRRIQGRGAIEEIHHRNFATIHHGSRIALHLLAARTLADNLALVHVRGLLHMPAGLLAGENASTQTMVLAERDAWRITAFHNTFVRETPPQAPAIDGA